MTQQGVLELTAVLNGLASAVVEAQSAFDAYDLERRRTFAAIAAANPGGIVEPILAHVAPPRLVLGSSEVEVVLTARVRTELSGSIGIGFGVLDPALARSLGALSGMKGGRLTVAYASRRTTTTQGLRLAMRIEPQPRGRRSTPEGELPK